MRTTIVPAQITTVEDKIAGNLTLTQILLLLAPIFLACILYIVLPPKLNFAVYKLLLIVASTVIFSILAIRIKGYLVLYWIVILLRYNSRPRYYLFNKNELYLREFVGNQINRKNVHVGAALNKATITHGYKLSIKDIFALEKYIDDPNGGLSVKFSQKGGMSVSLSKVE
jgi:hypothetical protein